MPELYNLTWGMGMQEASEVIEVEHSIINEKPIATDAGLLIIDSYDFLGYVGEVCCYFDLEMDFLYNVLFLIPNEVASFETIENAIADIYSEPDKSEQETYARWFGKTTEIMVFNGAMRENKTDSIFVYFSYRKDINDFFSIEDGGNRIDPMRLLNQNALIGKNIDEVLIGLTEDSDYIKQEYSSYISFSNYTFFPEFEYFGVEPGRTAIETSVSSGKIDTFSYVFSFDKTSPDTIIEKTDEIRSEIVRIYGSYDSCSYYSYNVTERPVDCTPEEQNQKIKQLTVGGYYTQWETETFRITLNIDISADSSRVVGDVTFAPISK